MSERRTPEAEHHALDVLLHSEGWVIVHEMVTAAYGPEAFERAIDSVMTELRPGDDERAVVTQIRAAHKAARDVLARVEERFKDLQHAEAKKTTPSRPFAAFRRVPR